MPHVKTPKLHRVRVPWDYDEKSYNGNVYAIRTWCDYHCRAAHYQYPGWTKSFDVQFEDSDDAVEFEKWVMWQTLSRS